MSLTKEQINEFNLNRLGYYVKIKQEFDKQDKKSKYRFYIVKEEDYKEELIQEGKKLFPIDFCSNCKTRNEIIEAYLKKVKKELGLE